MRASFLRSPISYTRISSGFRARACTPSWKRVRPHLGVDFAAPAGTPVWAPADGVVVARTRDAAGGNRIALRHGGGYESATTCTSRASPPGSRSATGSGRRKSSATSARPGFLPARTWTTACGAAAYPVNPVKEAFPRAEQLPPQFAAQFAEYRTWLDGQAYTPFEGGIKLASR